MEIPRIDIAPFLNGTNKASVSEHVATSCRDIGFLIIKGHGLECSTMESAFDLTRAFMDFPQADKDKWHPKGPSKQRGYHGFATRSLATTLDNDAPADYEKRSF